MSQLRQRIAVGLLTVSLAGFGAWKASEGFTDTAVIPTKGDVPTIGHGSTRYEDGKPVKMGDTITRPHAELLARNLNSQTEKQFAASLPGVKLHQVEFDLYMDFTGQYGIGNWRSSSMRRDLIAGEYARACTDLLKYRYAAGFDCSTPGNKQCWGVWSRQLERNAKCKAAQ
ncbi:glycoside hydrolase family protein [Pseudomonas sp. CCI3.1]|uniref:glycoside hydrolase family protein n=1 Tax=Pseudomonas sp. CCI3.1 TaxID=3048618 RepID=UPI002AB390A4|nr:MULTISPECIES: glycoside hydrolase family protein [unclassified Pseudomonas]MDY7581200.1 glycoside hydrolase family protein [Pseudomonas sp. CCI3.1]MEB0069963.1 glycoside hydrolase family protein [Pseudomonas sp. CCI3.1]MEB0073021.1 glycoside hydrolase family protein [Pseudomonas sp. CCI1.4]